MLTGCGVTEGSLFNNPSLRSSRQLGGSLENSRTGYQGDAQKGLLSTAQSTQKSFSTLEEEMTARMGCPATNTALRYGTWEKKHPKMLTDTWRPC